MADIKEQYQIIVDHVNKLKQTHQFIDYQLNAGGLVVRSPGFSCKMHIVKYELQHGEHPTALVIRRIDAVTELCVLKRGGAAAT